MSNYLLAALIAFLLCVALLFLLLPLLKRKKAGQEILEYVKEHSYKSGTPTMGGIAIILAMLTAALIFGKGKFVYITLAVAFAYGVTGFLDDSIKIRYKRNLGLRPYQKIILQLSIALIVAFVVYKNELIRGDVYIPFTKNTVSLGWGVIPLVVFIFIATTNSVNLTDGLDGLAASTTLVYMAGIAAIIAIVAADADKNGLSLYVKEYQGLLTVCFATVGSLAGFLLSIALDAVGSGKMMENVLAAWGKVYLPENFVLPVTIENDNAITIAVVAILGIGVFGFWCRKSLERQSVWLVIALSLGGMICYGMTSAEMQGFTLLYLIIAVVAGAGVQAVLPYELTQQNALQQVRGAVEEPTAETKPKKRQLKIQDLEEEGLPAETDNKVQLIENPLPVPKKHVPKVLDYKLNDDVSDFDYPVADDDDFDH